MTDTLEENFRNLTTLQKELYYPSGPEEAMASWFHEDFMKSLYHDNFLVEMSLSADGEKTRYTINTAYKYLIYSYLRFQSPWVKVKEEHKDDIRIALCSNFGTNVVVDATLMNDNDTINTLHPIVYDDKQQFFPTVGPNKDSNYNKGIGNVNILQNWSTYLPSYPINVFQPWYYSEHSSLAFPIYHKGTETKAAHIYTFQKDVIDLIRVQHKIDDVWVDVKNVEKINYIDIEYRSFKGDYGPKLYGKYSNITEAELESYECVLDDKDDKGKKEKIDRVYYFIDNKVIKSTNVQKCGTNFEVSINLEVSILAIFWKALNVTAQKNGNFSNYTTNKDNLLEGWDPIKNNTLETPTRTFFKDLPSDHFNIAESNNFPGAPTINGYHGYSFSLDHLSKVSAGSTTVLKNATLTCSLQNRNIYGEIDTITKNDDEFQLYVNLMYYRKMILTYDNKGLPIIKVI